MHFLQVIPEGVNGEKGNLLNCIHPNQVEVLPKDLADWYGWRRNDRSQVVPPAIFWTTGAWSCPCCSRRSPPTWSGRTFWDLVMLPTLRCSPVVNSCAQNAPTWSLLYYLTKCSDEIHNGGSIQLCWPCEDSVHCHHHRLAACFCQVLPETISRLKLPAVKTFSFFFWVICVL